MDKNNVVRKGLVFGIIVLFIGASIPLGIGRDIPETKDAIVGSADILSGEEISAVPQNSEPVFDSMPEITISYVVQPDRINRKNQGYDLLTFQNDEVVFDVYLTNSGNVTAENVTAILNVTDGSGFNLTDNVTNYGDVGPDDIFVGNFSFLAENVSTGLYNCTLAIAYQDAYDNYTSMTNLTVKVTDVGITKITQSVTPSIYRNESEQEFLTPLDSVIIGYNALFLSNDEKIIIIRVRNGGNVLMENLTVDILPPSDVNIEIQNIPTFNASTVYNDSNDSFVYAISDSPHIGINDYKDIAPRIILTDVDAGVYNLTIKLNYSDVAGDHELIDNISIGVYEADYSIDITYSKEDDIKDFIVSTDLDVVSPHLTTCNISTSAFNVSDIMVPENATEVQNSIKNIIEKAIPSYLNNSTLEFQKENWLNAQLLNSTTGEKRKIYTTILSNYGKYIGERFGAMIIQNTMEKVFENEMPNPLLGLGGVIIATGAGSYYYEIVFKDMLSNSSFIDDHFIVNERAEINLTFTGNQLDNVTISEGNLEAYTNLLPMELIEISDENTTYTPISGWEDIVIDNLPMIVKVNITELLQTDPSCECVIENETVNGGLVLGSSNKTRGFDGYVENNDTLIIYINSIEVGDWNGIVSISFLRFSNQTNTSSVISGVSQLFNFTVTDAVELFDPHNFTNLNEFIHPNEFVKMNNATRYTRRVFHSDFDVSNPMSTDFHFEKGMEVNSSYLHRLELVTLQYNESTDTTDVRLLVESSINISNASIVVNALRFDEKYSEWIDYESVEEPIGALEESVSTEVDISINGRYGTDFNTLNYYINRHSRAAITIATIWTAVGVITTIDWAYSKIKSLEGKAIAKITEELEPTMKIQVGEAYKIVFKVEFKFENSCRIWHVDDEWIFFEYVVLVDGEIKLNERIPKNGWYKDTDAYAGRQVELWLGAKEWYCSCENDHTVEIIAMVWDDGSDYGGQNPDECSYPHHISYNYKKYANDPDCTVNPIFCVPRKHRWINRLDEDKDKMTVTVYNPFYITDIVEDTEQDHDVDNVSLKFEARARYKYKPKYETARPNEVNIAIDPLNDKDNWDFEPEPTSSLWEYDSAPPPPEKFRWVGVHNDPEHPGVDKYYSDQYSLKASGTTTVHISKGKKKSFDWETWFTKEYAEGDNCVCLPSTFTAVCHDDDGTLVTLSTFDVYSESSQNNIVWTTATELGTLGFNILRSTTIDGPYTKLNDKLIPGGKSDYKGYSYVFEDTSVQAGETYYYQLEEVDDELRTTTFGPTEPVEPPSGLMYYEGSIGMDVSMADHGGNGIAFEPLPGDPVSLENNHFRIYIKEEGMHRLDSDIFAAYNIDMSTIDPRNIHMTFKGQEIPIRVTGKDDGTFDTDDTVIFYVPVNDEPYADALVYSLWADDTPGLRMGSRDGTPAGGAPAEDFASVFENYDKVFYLRVARGGLHWYAERLVAPSTCTMPFELLNFADEDMTLTLDVWSLMDHPDCDPDHHLQIFVNDNLLGDEYWNGRGWQILTYTVPAELVNDGENVVRLEFVDDVCQWWTLIYVKGFSLSYRDRFVAENDALTFETNNEHFYVSGFTNDQLYVFDVSDINSVTSLENVVIDFNDPTYAVSFSDAQQTTYYVIAETALKTPDFMNQVEPSDIKDTSNAADYLVIANDGFVEEVQPLADHRQSKGLQVKVVKTSEIYDEFSNGHLSPVALKDFLSYAVAQWAVAPEYVLFVGDGSFDYKNYLGDGIQYVPTYMVEQTGPYGDYIGETGSDSWFADVDDDGVPDLKLGRLPGVTDHEINTMVSKILHYENDLQRGPWNEHIVLAADDGYFDEILDEATATYMPSKYQTSTVYLDSYSDAETATDDLISLFEQGTSLAVFNGHGSPGLWTIEHLLDAPVDIPTIDNQGKLPFILTLTCVNAMFKDYSSDDNTVEYFMKQENNKGAVSLFSSSGIVYQSAQNAFLNELFNQLFTHKITELGELVVTAQQHIMTNDPGKLHAVQSYALFGDPAMNLVLTKPSQPRPDFPFITKSKENTPMRITPD